MSEALLTLAEVAKRLRVSLRTLEREIAEGKLHAIKLRHRRMIVEADLAAYIAALRCQCENVRTVGKSESASAVADALKRRFRPAPLELTRSRSKLLFVKPQ